MARGVAGARIRRDEAQVVRAGRTAAPPAGAAVSHGHIDPNPTVGGGVAPNAYRIALARLRPAFVAALVFSAAVSVLMLTGSIYMLQVYDRVLGSGSVPTLLALFAIVVVLHVFLAIYDFLRSRLLARAALRLDQALAPMAFRAWLRDAVPGHGNRPGEGRGDSRPLLDLDGVRGFLSGPAATGLMDIPFAPIFLAVLFLIHPLIGWATVAGAGVVVGIALANRALTRAPIARGMAGDAAARDFAEAGRQGAEAVLAMGMTGAVTGRWRALQTGALAAGQQGSDPSEALAAASKAFRMLLQSAILTLGAWLVLVGEITPGMIIAASILSGRALAPVDQVIGQWRAIGRAAECHRRLMAYFDSLPAETPRIALPAPTGAIEVTGVTKYAPGQPRSDRSRILTQVSFRLEPGDGLGVIGNSAAGKSTLARLLTGAWTPDAGEIRLDGATPDQWDPDTLGRAIGYLPQNLDLMPGTIRDVIARFDPAAEDAAVIEAAKLVGVHEMILGLPDGYATRIGTGPGTVPLSGGQSQRLGLARAVFGRPNLVVLDEPNANLDVAGDEALSQAVAQLRARGATVVVMAHRPSAIAAVNKLLILHNGRVLQFGDKETALAGNRRQPAAPTPAAPAAPAPIASMAPVAISVGAPQADRAARPDATPAPIAAPTAAPIGPLRLDPALRVRSEGTAALPARAAARPAEGV